MMWHDLRERYDGEWSQGRQHGWGEHTWLRPQLQSTPFQMRERYVGQWLGLGLGFNPNPNPNPKP